jgi:hypothetical protein
MGERMMNAVSRQATLAVVVAGAALNGLGCGGEDQVTRVFAG